MVKIASPGPLSDPWSLLFEDLPLPGFNIAPIGPWPDRITGRVTLQVYVRAATGPCDVKVEALVHNFYTGGPNRIYKNRDDGSIADLSLLVPSSRTLIGHDTIQGFHIQAPEVDLPGMYIVVSGVGENGSDTVVSCSYTFGVY